MGLDALCCRERRRHSRRLARHDFPTVRLDRGNLVAGDAFVDNDQRAKSDAGQLADPDRARAADFAERRQTRFWMNCGHIE